MKKVHSYFKVLSYCDTCFMNKTFASQNYDKFLKNNYLPLFAKQNFDKKSHNNDENFFKRFVKNIAVGASVGFPLLCILKKYYDPWAENNWNIFPVVYAASPKGQSSPFSSQSNSISNYRNNFNFIADVVEKVSDGVVFIDIKDHRRIDRHGNKMSMSNGSGFIVESDGLILTNAHVVTNKPRASSIVVRLSNGEEYEGKIEELDAVSDLALVRIKCDNLKPMSLGSSKDTRPGEFVVALGSPLSLSNTITSGVISSVGRASKDLGLRGRNLSYIQTDAAITFGNSGGPLVNLDGDVIGINSMKVTSGISFAIPIDYAVEFLSQMKKKKKFIAQQKEDVNASSGPHKRYIGITMLTLTPEIILELQQRGSPAHTQIPSDLSNGILIWRVVVGSPAYYAGLQPGDIITNINGHEVESSKEVYKILESQGDLRMVLIRGSQRYNVTVSPEE